MNGYGGLKRSYYREPELMENFRWHLYESGIEYYTFAFARLEVKRVNGKKSRKGKLSKDSVINLQMQMGKLAAEFPSHKKSTGKGRVMSNLKEENGKIYLAANAKMPTVEGFDSYILNSLNGSYLT